MSFVRPNSSSSFVCVSHVCTVITRVKLYAIIYKVIWEIIYTLIIMTIIKYTIKRKLAQAVMGRQTFKQKICLRQHFPPTCLSVKITRFPQQQPEGKITHYTSILWLRSVRTWQITKEGLFLPLLLSLHFLGCFPALFFSSFLFITNRRTLLSWDNNSVLHFNIFLVKNLITPANSGKGVGRTYSCTRTCRLFAVAQNNDVTNAFKFPFHYFRH
jgi:hypothetical protein